MPPKRTREELKARADRKKRAFRQKLAYRTKTNYAKKGSNGVTSLTRPPRSVQPSFGGPIGQTFETELSYAEYFSIDPGIGAPASFLFHCNGLYDPNHTGTGHQPHGFDQLMALYKNYQVLSSTIEAVMFPQLTPTSVLTTSGTGGGTINAQHLSTFLAIAVRDTANLMTGGLTVNTDILERPNVKVKFANSNSEPLTIRSSWSMPQWYGKTKGLDDADSTGNAGANPVEGVYYHIIFGPNDGSTNLESHKFMARMKFKVRFFNPVDASGS